MNEETSLIDRAVEGTLTPTEVSSLQELLKCDFLLRQQYYETLATEHLLDEQFGKNVRMEQALRRNRSRGTALSGSNRSAALSLAAAFVLIASILAGLHLMKTLNKPVRFVSTSESRIFVDGSAHESASMKPGQRLSLREGTIKIMLNPYTTALLTAPAEIRIRDKRGNVDLLSGAAYFEVNAKGSDACITLHAAGRVIRDIGTKFGVIATSPNAGEAHVFSGAISISKEDSDSEELKHLSSGSAVTWSDQTDLNGIALNSQKFLTSLPKSFTLLADDFDDPDGTSIDGKATDIGSPWNVVAANNIVLGTNVSQGKFDSSHGSRELHADFRYDPPIAGKSNVYVADFLILPPTVSQTVDAYPNGQSKIFFRGVGGAPLVALSAAIKDNDQWRIVNEVTGTASPLLSESPSRKVALRFVYDSRNGKATLRPVSASSPRAYISLTLQAGLRFSSLSILNFDGGDIALDSLRIENISYPVSSASAE